MEQVQVGDVVRRDLEDVLGAGAAEVLNKFPDEIWTIIFGNLYGSSNDLLNCTRVCQKWERILKPNQCTWLFDQIFPFIFPYLEKKDILATSQVGKQWRKVVNDFVETHESRLPFDEARSNIARKSLYSPLQSKKIKWNTFYEREQLLRFMNIMGESSSPETNIIFGRSLWLEFQEETENEDENFQENSKFWPTVFQFLTTYGSQLWYFTIGTYGTRNTCGRFLYLLNRCLTLMPNLKSLHIFGWINEIAEEDNDEEYNLTIDQVPSHLERHPLPVLPFLETLEIDNMSGLPTAIQDHIISVHSQQLKCLQLSEWEEGRLVTSIELPQLKELHLDVARYHPMDKIGTLLTHISSSPLGKMSLSFSSLESTLNMERLFELINNFSGSLRSLRLSVIPGYSRRNKEENNGQDSSQLKLFAPKLQALHLEGFDRLPLTFLIHLSSSLEYLELRPLSATVRKTCYPDECIDLYQYLHCKKVYDSRCWLDLPKLKAVYFEICSPCEGRFVDLCFSRATFDYLEDLKKVSTL